MLYIIIGGASASGKTELAKGLVATLLQEEIKAVSLSMDDYYKRAQDRVNLVDPHNMDVPEAFDLELYHNQLQALNDGDVIDRPVYSFHLRDRLEETKIMDPEDIHVVVIEGILALHKVDELGLPNVMTIFIESDSYLAYLKRREVRDEHERATTKDQTRSRELNSGVRNAYFQHILPTRRLAEFIVTNNDCEVGSPKEASISKIIEELMPDIKDKLATNSFEFR